MSTQKDEVVVHTLLTREIRPIHNWHEWLAHWQAAKDLQWMESLLHVGFSVPLEQEQYGEKKYDRIDRDIFYFTIADGWADSFLFRLPEDQEKEYKVGHDSNWNVIKKTPSELRQQLAGKAFDMLCSNFFKVKLGNNRDGFDFPKVWKELIVSERLFPVIQNFFRVEKGRYSDFVEILNLSLRDDGRSHNERQAVNFLLNLAQFLWTWKEPDTSWPNSKEEKTDERLAAMRVRVDTAKPWMIEVLAVLKRLDVLQGWILKLDEACLAKLKEIALSNELKTHQHPVIKARLVATLDEACYLGSETAWFLKEHELMTKEHKRLGTILEAERKKVEADREIKKLTSK